jgi:nucleoside-diphosphate-sugar epimerase
LRVLVTGGSGFIGSHVVDKLLDAGHEPVIFDLEPSPYHSREQARTVKGDVTDIGALSRALGVAARSSTSLRWPTSAPWRRSPARPSR